MKKIRKYDDKFINLSKIAAVEKINVVPLDGENICVFEVVFGNAKIVFSNPEWEPLENLREKIVKDWMEVANDKKYLCTN